MITPKVAATIDPTSAERLGVGFANVFETFDSGDGVLSPDCFFDLNMPV